MVFRTATDIDEGDTLSYSIYSRAFSMSAVTGAITVGSALDYKAKRWYALTVQVSDGEGGTATGYRVLRRRAQVDDAFVSLADVAASTSMYVDSRDVAAGAKYVYRVVAVYDGGDARVAVTAL